MELETLEDKLFNRRIKKFFKINAEIDLNQICKSFTIQNPFTKEIQNEMIRQPMSFITSGDKTKPKQALEREVRNSSPPNELSGEKM